MTYKEIKKNEEGLAFIKKGNENFQLKKYLGKELFCMDPQGKIVGLFCIYI